MSNPANLIATQLREAIALHTQGQLEIAEAKYQALLVAAPRNFTALHMLGVLYLQRGQNIEAEQILARALKIEPRDAPTLSNRGLALRALRHFDEALLCFDKAVLSAPTSPVNHYNRAITLHDLNREDEAIAAFDRAITLQPDYADAHADRANTLWVLGRLDEALTAFDMAHVLRPPDARTLYNRGQTLMRLARYDEARESFSQAIALQADFAEAHTAMGECLLAQGHYGPGWEAYEWRRAVQGFQLTQHTFTTPPWRGESDISGKTLLLYAEQGFGDAIQFCRYAQMAAKRGARIVLEVQPELTSLVASLGSDIHVIARGAPLPSFDLHAPLMSLPLAFKTDGHSIPSAASYLAADPQSVTSWRRRRAEDMALHVGIVWSGRATHLNDRNRSIPLHMLKPILATVGVEFIALQPDVRAADQETLSNMATLKLWGMEVQDFSDTAALIAALDLVITVDTAVAHLAGALGKPVWLLLPYVADWRWLLGRADSPWYPSMRIVRQPAIGAWSDVIASVAANLRGLV